MGPALQLHALVGVALVVFILVVPHSAALVVPAIFKEDDVRNRLALTYEAALSDGAGSQLQRVYGIYCIAKGLGLPYFHTPMSGMTYHGLAAMEKNEASNRILERYKRVMSLPSDLPDISTWDVVHIEDFSLEQLEKVAAAVKSSQRNTLIKIAATRHFLDYHPDLYLHASSVSPFASVLPRSDVVRVAIHVRRGELFVVDSDRMLPNQYYINTALAIKEILDGLGLSYVFELHTEVPTKAFSVSGSHHGIGDRIKENIVVKPEQNHINDFDVIPNLVKAINQDTIYTFQQLATADILVMSRSSFSYTSAILSNSIVVFCPFWHPPLSTWLPTIDGGGLGEASKLGVQSRLKQRFSKFLA